MLAAAAVFMLAGCDQLLDAMKDGNTGDTDDTSGEPALLEEGGIVLNGEEGTITLKFTGNIEELEDFVPTDYIKIEPAGSSSSGEKVALIKKGEAVEDNGETVHIYMELEPKGPNDNGEYEYKIKLEAVVKFPPSRKVEFAVLPADKPEPQASMYPANLGTGPLAAQFSEGGTGGETIELDAMIEVADKETLALISADNELYKLNEKYKQTADITISGTWTPIGTDQSRFKGNFDGGGYKIFPNITSNNYFSIFGYTDEATFENVHIGEGSMTTDKGIGGIASGAKDTTFINCSNAATLKGNVAGGICYSLREGPNSYIIDCWNIGDITGRSQAGGICGGIGGVGNIIQNCYNSGSVTAETAGGISGSSAAKIIACYNTGTITGTNNKANENSWTINVGGISGEIGGNGTMGGGQIIACYNTGDVTSNENLTDDDWTEIYIGGITGWNSSVYPAIAASYSTGTPSYTGNDEREISLVYVGGISGYSTYTDEDTDGVTKIEACYFSAVDALYGVGGQEYEDFDWSELAPPCNTGTEKFDSAVWPAATYNTEWGTGDGNGSGKYWKSLGGWNGGNPVYPKLAWEKN